MTTKIETGLVGLSSRARTVIIVGLVALLGAAVTALIYGIIYLAIGYMPNTPEVILFQLGRAPHQLEYYLPSISRLWDILFYAGWFGVRDFITRIKPVASNSNRRVSVDNDGALFVFVFAVVICFIMAIIAGCQGVLWTLIAITFLISLLASVGGALIKRRYSWCWRLCLITGLLAALPYGALGGLVFGVIPGVVISGFITLIWLIQLVVRAGAVKQE